MLIFIYIFILYFYFIFLFYIFISYFYFIFLFNIFSSCFISSIKWYIGYVGPRSFTEMVNFIFSCKFSRGGWGRGGGARKFAGKNEIDHFFTPGSPKGALYSYLHVRHIYMSIIYTCPTYIDYIQYTYMSKKHSVIQKMDL